VYPLAYDGTGRQEKIYQVSGAERLTKGL
jgi:hypothetical protein